MKIIEKQRLSTEDVRAVCIENNYYACGTCEEYAAMFAKVRKLEKLKVITAKALQTVAEDIAAHSNLRTSEGEDVTTVMFALARKIVRTYEYEF